MSIHIVRNIKPEQAGKIVEMIYLNFIDLVDYPELKHNKTELTRLVTSPKAKLLLTVVKGKIAAYLSWRSNGFG